jgi:hypothetical protein
MSSSLYFLAFAFLATSSLLFLTWHCRLARLRQRELRRLEEERLAREAELGEARVVAMSSLTLVTRGAPAALIAGLPTYVFGGGGGGGAAAAAGIGDDKVGGFRPARGAWPCPQAGQAGGGPPNGKAPLQKPRAAADPAPPAVPSLAPPTAHESGGCR